MSVDSPLPPSGDGANRKLDVSVVADARALEVAWRALEAEGVTTPFQCFDWVSAWIAARASDDKALVVAGRRGERLDFVLPFEIRRSGPARIAHWMGGRHASYGFGLWRRGTVPTAGEITAALDEVGRAQSVDVFVLENMPSVCDGMDNPLAAALSSRAALDDGHCFHLDPSFDALIAGRNAGHKRKKVRSKEKILAAAGGYRIAPAAGDDEARESLAAFFAQKADSLGRLGIDDPFARAEVRAFYTALATGPAPLLEVTRLEAGGAIRAVLGSIVRGTTSHQLFVSAARDDMARASPGETLFYRHIETACGRGLEIYDMGMGAERYKASWCDETVALVSAVHAVTPFGRVIGAGLDVAGRIKARIRRDEKLWARVRELRARLIGRAASDGEAG